MLDKPGLELGARLANKIYESCRAGRLEIPNFPNFDPTIEALKNRNSQQESQDFKVCKQQGNRLIILESFASKFLESDQTADRAKSVIDGHNEQYNQDGEFVLGERIVFLVREWYGLLEC